MRIGISSRGNAWMSMGPIGWLILGSFILAWWLAWMLIVVLVQFCVLVVRAIRR